MPRKTPQPFKLPIATNLFNLLENEEVSIPETPVEAHSEPTTSIPKVQIHKQKKTKKSESSKLVHRSSPQSPPHSPKPRVSGNRITRLQSHILASRIPKAYRIFVSSAVSSLVAQEIALASLSINIAQSAFPANLTTQLKIEEINKTHKRFAHPRKTMNDIPVFPKRSPKGSFFRFHTPCR